jgi:hypothetical protein
MTPVLYIAEGTTPALRDSMTTLADLRQRRALSRAARLRAAVRRGRNPILRYVR